MYEILNINHIFKMADNTRNFSIRKANSDDLEDLKKLLSQLTTVGDPFPDSINPSIYENIYVACLNDRIIGTITVLIEPKIIHRGGSVGHIEDIVVDKNYRKMGIGKLLINHVLDIAKERGCYKIILDCDEDNMGFYEKAGFKQKGVCMRCDVH